MSIRGKVEELQSIKREITASCKRTSKLRKREKELKIEIDEYLTYKDQPGLKYGNMAIIRDTKPTRKPKKKKERERDSIDVLGKYVDDPEKVLLELLEARRGNLTDNYRIMVKPIKKKK